VKKRSFAKLVESVKQTGEIRRSRAKAGREFAFQRTAMKSIRLTDLRRNLSKVLKLLKTSKDAILITRRGMAVAVLMSMEVFEKLEHDRQLLRLLVQGDKEIANRPVNNRKRKLENMVAGITEKNLHKEDGWGPADAG